MSSWNRSLLFAVNYIDANRVNLLASTGPQAVLLRCAPQYSPSSSPQTINNGDRAELELSNPGSVQSDPTASDHLVVYNSGVLVPNVDLEVGTEPELDLVSGKWRVWVENNGPGSVTLDANSILAFPTSTRYYADWSYKSDGMSATTGPIAFGNSGRLEVYTLLSEFDLVLRATSGFLDTYIPCIHSNSALTVSVRDFGAIGNDVDDDRQCIQSAIDYVAARGGGEVYLPAGHYRIGGPLQLRSYVRLRGDGAGTGAVNATSIRAIYVGPMLQAFGVLLSESACIDRVQLIDLDIHGDTGSDYATCGLEVTAGRNWSIRRCRFVGIRGTFVKFTQVWDTWIYDTYFDWAAEGTTDPMVDIRSYVSGQQASNSNSIHFTNCRWGGYRTTAVRMLGNGDGRVNNIYMTACQMESGFASPRLYDMQYCTRIFLNNCSVSVSRFNSGMGDYILRAEETHELFVDNFNVNFQPVLNHEQGGEMPLLGLKNVEGVTVVGGAYETKYPAVPPIQVIEGNGDCISVYGLIVMNNQTWQLVPNANVVGGTTSVARNAFSGNVYVGATAAEPVLTMQRVAANGDIDGRWYLGRVGPEGNFRILRGGSSWEQEALVIGYANGEAGFRGRILPALASGGGILKFGDGDATPSVQGGNVFLTENSSATSISTLDEGANGQQVVVIVTDSNTTFLSGQGLALRGGTNFAAGNGDVISFIWTGTVWREISRSEAP